MNNISGISQSNPVQRIDNNQSKKSGQKSSNAPQTTRGNDNAEFSTKAKYLSKVINLPIREDLVNDIKSRIADGSYESQDKIDSLLDNLAQDLF